MFEQILALLIVVAFYGYFLLTWKLALVERERLKEDVLKVLRSPDVSKTAKGMVYTAFMDCGSHWSMMRLLVWCIEFRISRRVEKRVRRSVTKVESELLPGELEKVVDPILHRSFVVSNMQSPFISLLTRFALNALGSPSKQGDASHLYLDYAEFRAGKPA